MNSIERVTMALNHQEPDHVPVYPLINSMSRTYLGIDYAEWSQDPHKCAQAIIKATEACDVDVICNLVDLSVEAADWGMEVRFPSDKAASPASDPFVKNPDEYEKIGVIDPYKGERMSKAIQLTKELVDAKGSEKPVVAFVFGPLGILSMLRGLQGMLMDTFSAKDKMHKALENITETLIKYVDALIDTGCHAIMFDTLYASKTIMRAKMWCELEGPYIKRLADHVHERGCMVMIHNCGEGTYFKEQIEYLKPEAISTLFVPADCETMEEMKEKYGDQTTIIGMVNPGNMMSYTPDQLREECRLEIDALAKGGGFVLATGCEYPANMDDEYAKIMVEEAKTYGAYNK